MHDCCTYIYTSQLLYIHWSVTWHRLTDRSKDWEVWGVCWHEDIKNEPCYRELFLFILCSAMEYQTAFLFILSPAVELQAGSLYTLSSPMEQGMAYICMSVMCNCSSI